MASAASVWPTIGEPTRPAGAHAVQAGGRQPNSRKWLAHARSNVNEPRRDGSFAKMSLRFYLFGTLLFI